MRPSVVLVAALLAPAVLGAAEDVVLLTNGQRLRGTLDTSVEAKPGTTAIRTSEGLVRIRSDLVASVDESFASRRGKVADTDADGLYRLARWCLAKNMRSEALDLLARAVALPTCPIEARGLYARLVDEDSPERALPLYQLYRGRGGTDTAILARLKQLEDELAAFTGTAAPGGATAAPVAVNDGFESRGWDADSPQWSNPARVETVKVSQGESTNNVVSVACTGGTQDKTAVKRALRGITAAGDAELRFFVVNDGTIPLRLAVALKTGNWVFHESKQVTIAAKKEWQEVRIPLRSNDWKTQASGWNHSVPVADLEDLKELQFLIFNGRSDCTLLFDAIEFVKPRDL